MRGQAKPELLDLRKVTRCGPRDSKTVISVDVDYRMEPWIYCGTVDLFHHSTLGYWTLEGHLGRGATDYEHDSSHAFRLQLVGVELQHVFGGRAAIGGWVHAADPDDFRVPAPGYNPFKDEEVSGRCETCKGEDAHSFAPYLPPPNPELHQLLAGRRVEIVTGLVKFSDEE